MIFGNEHITDQQHNFRMVYFPATTNTTTTTTTRFYCPENMWCGTLTVMWFCNADDGIASFIVVLKWANLKTCHQLLIFYDFPMKSTSHYDFSFFYFVLSYRWPYTHIYIESIMKTKRTSIQIQWINCLTNWKKKREKKTATEKCCSGSKYTITL